MIEITRMFGFDAGHRILGHESKCANLHGHRYTAEVSCTSPGDSLDPLGRVIDFGKVKEVVGGWIDEYWDHNMILNSQDSIYPKWSEPLKKEVFESMRANVFGPKAPYLMECNPTAENMAKELYYTAATLLAPLGIHVTQIKLWETPNCFAIYRP